MTKPKSTTEARRHGEKQGTGFPLRRADHGRGITCVILSALKTSISIPDHLFRLAEAAVRKLKMSRSQLYATALAEYLERHQASKVTERLNEIYSEEPSSLDPTLASAQLKSIGRDSP